MRVVRDPRNRGVSDYPKSGVGESGEQFFAIEPNIIGICNFNNITNLIGNYLYIKATLECGNRSVDSFSQKSQFSNTRVN